LKEGGIEITGLLSNSPIQAAGLHVGDVIKAVDLKLVKTAEEIREAAADRGPGANV
jgi:S1-C subfamily serine protease